MGFSSTSCARRGRRNARNRSRRLARAAVLLLLSLALPACGSRQPAGGRPGEVLFDGTLDDLIPHQAGSRFVYRATGAEGNERILTSLVWPTRDKDEIVSVLLRGELVLSEMRLRFRDGTLAIVSEAGPQQNLAISYRDPLPLVTVPVTAGEKTFKTRVKLLRLSDGEVLAEGDMEQRAIVSERGRSFGRRGWIVLRFERTMTLPERVTRSRSKLWVEPGVGQVRVEMGGADDEPSERRDLVCAVLGGREVGDCKSIAASD